MNRIVKEIRNFELISGGRKHSGWLPANAAVPAETPIVRKRVNFQIRQAESSSSFFLVTSAVDGEFEWDTWHESLDDAMHQATIEFGIEATDWSEPSGE